VPRELRTHRRSPPASFTRTRPAPGRVHLRVAGGDVGGRSTIRGAGRVRPCDDRHRTWCQRLPSLPEPCVVGLPMRSSGTSGALRRCRKSVGWGAFGAPSRRMTVAPTGRSRGIVGAWRKRLGFGLAVTLTCVGLLGSGGSSATGPAAPQAEGVELNQGSNARPAPQIIYVKPLHALGDKAGAPREAPAPKARSQP